MVRIVKDKAIGYWYFTDRQHPMANSQGKVYLHRHVAMLKIGRPLLRTEHAHHKDGNKDNNESGNIEVLTCVEHAKRHNPKTIVERNCEKCGRPTFNKFFCSERCAKFARRVVARPSKNELLLLLRSLPVVKIAERCGVASGTTVSKWAKHYGIDMRSESPFSHKNTFAP